MTRKALTLTLTLLLTPKLLFGIEDWKPTPTEVLQESRRALWEIPLHFNVYTDEGHVHEIGRIATLLDNFPQEDDYQRIVRSEYIGNLAPLILAAAGFGVGYVGALTFGLEPPQNWGALWMGTALGGFLGRVAARQERRVLSQAKPLLIARLSGLVNSARAKDLYVPLETLDTINRLKSEMPSFKEFYEMDVDYKSLRWHVSIRKPTFSLRSTLEAAVWGAGCAAGLAKMLGAL